VYRQQEKIGKEREEVERQRKLLGKRKPPVATAAASKQPKATKDGDVFLKPADKPLVTCLLCTKPLVTVLSSTDKRLVTVLLCTAVVIQYHCVSK